MDKMQFTKSIIPIEIELGFVRIPTGFKKLFPKENAHIGFYLGEDKKTELLYNSKLQRVFGLRNFYKTKKVEPRDILRFEKISEKKFKISLEKISQQELAEKPLSKDEADEIIDMGEISSQAKGNIVESRVKELVTLYGQGVLNVYEPSADIEGIDLVVLKRKVFQPLFIQVKSNFKLRGNNLQISVKSKTLSPHHTFFIVGAYYNPQKMDIDDYIVFAPSKDFIDKANIINKGTDKETYVLSTPLRANTHNRFSEFIIRKDSLVPKIFEKFSEIEKYYK